MPRRWNCRQKGCLLVALLILLASCGSTCARSYQLDVTGDAGGIVSAYGRSMNGSFEISGFSSGEGRFYRITEINVNDVRMRERISAGEGSIDAEEWIYMVSEAIDDPTSEVIKLPETQTFSVYLEEAWPVVLKADRKIDYMGALICDREAFGNDLDYVRASYLYNSDYRKERTVDLWLNRTVFTGKVADDPLEVPFLPPNRVISNKSLYYAADSISDGVATLSYRQVGDDRSILGEGYESYCGSFRIARTISMRSPGMGEEDEEVDWLFCSSGDQPAFCPPDESAVFGGWG